jgi:hypothetical protein
LDGINTGLQRSKELFKYFTEKLLWILIYEF